MTSEAKVLVYVEGGVVHAVYASEEISDLAVEILDGDDVEKPEEQLEELTRGMKEILFN